MPCSTIIYSENNKLFTYQTRALHHVLTFGSMTERKKHILHFVEFEVHMTLKISIFANFQKVRNNVYLDLCIAVNDSFFYIFM